MPKKPTTVDEYVASLTADRREAVQAVRGEINRRLPKGYEEGLQYGMISWCVPHSLFPAGYHCDPRQPLCFAALTSQKNHMSLYLMSVYGDAGQRRAFESEWAKSGKKLDMGKACIRFKRLEDLPLDVVGNAVARVPVSTYLKVYEAGRAQTKSATKTTRGAKKAGPKKSTPRKKARPSRKP